MHHSNCGPLYICTCILGIIRVMICRDIFRLVAFFFLRLPVTAPLVLGHNLRSLPHSNILNHLDWNAEVEHELSNQRITLILQ